MVQAIVLFGMVMVPGAEAPPRDQTGVHWVLPFTKAHKKAKEEKRLLAIKPIAFGTSADGGW
ncbi:MAG: hypothetical protein KatS3mg105_4763 [Gemmatales bacterium]|nr:MAG: hypothetical protein KatS3mg105_4763 [Gemmatales bacterium]